MKRTQVSDEWLYLHMPLLEEKLLDIMPEEDEIKYEFSDRFQEKMKKLLKRAVQKEKYKIPVTTWRRTAASIAVVLSAILMASLGVEAIRKEIYEFIQRKNESFTQTVYQVIKNEPVEFVPLYPEYIPEGYEMDICDQGDGFTYLSYMQSEKTGFWIYQEYITDGMSEYEDNDYISTKDVEVLGYEAILGEKADGVMHVKWRTESCIYIFVADRMEEEEILKICNSLKE